MKVDELRLEYDPVQTVRKGDSFSMKVPRKIRPSDRMYLWEDTKTE
jgi:putative protease